MSTLDGIIQTIFTAERLSQPVRQYDLVVGDKSTHEKLPTEYWQTDVGVGSDNQICGEVVRQTQPVTPGYEDGMLSTFTGSDFYFERIWVEPIRFDLQFIVEDLTRELKVWNAWRSKNVQLTDVQVLEQEGTYLEYPDLPDTLGTFGDTIYTLNIYGDGPPLQDTQYKLTIDGWEVTIYITGVRIIPWDLMPNWQDQLEISYEFATTIWTNDRFKEQRRALSRESWFLLQATYDASGNRSRKILNLIGYGKDKVFGLPVYNEMLTASEISGTTITVNEDFTYYYNLINRSSYIIIVDHEFGLAEIKEISSVNAPNEIVLSQTISETFDPKYTIIYPAAFVIIGSYSGTNITDDFDEVKVEFKEFKNG